MRKKEEVKIVTNEEVGGLFYGIGWRDCLLIGFVVLYVVIMAIKLG